MAVRLVTYDLRKKGQDYTGLLTAIKAYGAWAKLSESCYAISTNAEAKAIYENLKPYTDGNDNLLVMTLSLPWWGNNDPEVLEWLKGAL